MSTLRQNITAGKRYNYYIICSLPTGKVRIALPNTKDDKRLANRLQSKANEIEARARLFPTDKDWYVELHKALGLEHKLPNHNTDKHTIKTAWNQMLDSKMLIKDVRKNSTKEFYNASLKLLLEVVGNINLDMLSLQHRSAIEQVVSKKDWSDNTKNMRVKYINTFLIWCLENELILKRPFKLQLIKTKPRTQTWISKEDFSLIKGVSDNVSASYFTIAYNTGLRLRELTTDPKAKAYRGLYHEISRVDNLWQIKVYGKGNKEAVLILDDELKPIYDVMVANPIHPATISKKFKKACRKVGFENFRFHDLRHSYCQNLSMELDDAVLLRLMMRHSTLKTTENYMKDDKFAWSKMVESNRIEG
ncbi:tyrosine-type recombinase/integrase [Candidatus Marinimicrobia bacterium]|nr:tyrosine-type recombinase/integrase [Candidatus Neomarinimicrobiota bacterium]